MFSNLSFLIQPILNYFSYEDINNDEIENQHNRLARNLLLIGCPISGSLVIIFLVQQNYFALATAIGQLILCLFGLFFVRAGYHRKVVALVLSVCVMGNYACVLFGQGVTDFGYQSLYVMMIVVTMLLGQRWLNLFTGFNICFTISLFLGEELGLISFQDRVYSPLGGMVIAISLMALLYLILRFTVQQLVLSHEKITRAKIEAERASEAKSQFLANMSHELRTPLNAIIGYSEMMSEAFGNLDNIPSEIEEDILRISQSGRHLLELISDILDLSKAEANEITLHKDWFDLDQLLEEIENTMRPLMSKNNNAFEMQNKMTASVYLNDRVRLKQVLLNLISNAARFTENGEICLEVYDQEEVATFVVSDTGIGISPDMQQQIFRPFQQADNSLTRKYEGTGLGLAISKTIIERLGGDLSVKSELGKGSCFEFSIPILSKQAVTTEATKLNAKNHLNSSR